MSSAIAAGATIETHAFEGVAPDDTPLSIDVARHRGVAPAVDFVRKNWPHFRYVADTVCADTLATFVKVGHDAREWDHFAPFASSKGAAS